ncbi:MAG: NADH-quinone oxidoreductase subunit D [Planctomycetes bacterium]|nr:NADH-quinone oxidoreductase subunit D [Planctomycetota bacterium]
MVATFDVKERLRQRFAADVLHADRAGGMESITVKKDRIVEILGFLRSEPDLAFDFLSDLGGADGMRLDWPQWRDRFQVVYHLRSMKHGRRLRIKASVPESDCRMPSVTGLWKSANWMEREVFDLFGVHFDGHPNLKRILCHHKFVGHALRKDYDIHQGQWLDETESMMDEIGEYGENPDDGGFSELVPVNIGPAHPATHGTLRLFAKLDGETVVRVSPEIGYLHRGFEKHSESGSWTMVIPYTDRLNYCSAMLNNVAWCHGVEKMLGIEVPERTQYIRVIVSELSRIIDHAVCVAAMLVDLGALTNFWYLFNLRERIYSILEELCGARLTSTYVRIGGLAYDLNEGFIDQVRAILRDIPKNVGDVIALIKKNRIFLDRTVGVGAVSKELALSYSWTGPCLRASGVAFDLRKSDPYLGYENFDFEIPTYEDGDVYSRAMIRFDEIVQSMRIIEQALDRLPSGPIFSEDKRVHLPDKDKVYGSIEGLMNHFVLVYDGIKVPKGEGYHPIEAANGELGFYTISDGSGRPYRVRCRPPCFTIYSGYSEIAAGSMIADAVPILSSFNIIAGELDR